MQCVVPTCDETNSSRIASQGTTYFKFPTDPSIRAAWLETLRKTDWQPEENSAVCSRHFLPDDIVKDSNGLQTLHEGAIPVFTLEVCRICFAMDCKLYPLTTYRILNKAYETITGLLIHSDQIPHYLCNGCAHRLLECARFRTKSIESHSILVEIATKNNCITRESIISIHGSQNPLSTNEAHEHSEQYDIDNEVAEMERINNGTSQTDTSSAPFLFDEITIDCVKLETDIMDDVVQEEVARDVVDNVVQEEVATDKNFSVNVMVHIASVPTSPEHISADDYKAKGLNVLNNDIDDDKLKNDNASNDTLEGEQNERTEALLDSPHVEDDRQNERSNTEVQEDTMEDEVEVFMVIEDDSTIEESCDKSEDQNFSLVYDDSPNDSLELGEGEETAKQGTQVEQDVTNIPDNSNHKDDATTKIPQIEGENTSKDSLRLRELSQETEPSIKTVQQVRTIAENFNSSNSKILGNLNGICNPVLSCDKCPYQTINKIHMKSHLKAHSASKTYNCSFCSYITVHKRSIDFHTRIHSGEKPYPCDICDKRFSQKSSLLVHMRQHSGNKPYSCSICERKFKDITTLRRHVTIHTGEKPYSCEVCDKSFRQIGHLKKHILMHTGEKSYICDYCEKACSQKSHLKKHIMQIHIDNLRYACKICNKIFRRDVTLENHMRKHLSKSTYSCEVCKSVYSQQNRLRIHMKKHFV